ncbi:MAG: peptide-methionine (S)-S-oxide reductase MsrA, partial [Candidatus Neomarinimicrobiota bacterium]
AEVCQIYFDPGKITYGEILDIFWQAHDPTTINRQGGDIGSQYRSVILYHNQSQMEIGEKSFNLAGKKFESPLVTEILPLEIFYKAEEYHQDYFVKNPNQPYCALVIQPKLDKLRGLIK